MVLKDWIRAGRERGASDLLVEAGTPLVFRIRGELVPVGEPIAAERVRQLARQLIGGGGEEFAARRSADLSLTLAGVRCRVNIFQTLRGTSLAIRLLTSFQTSLRDCNLHPDLRRLVEPRAGLVLVSGPTGSGKSTTLAALVGELNGSQRRNILTVESPIEYYFPNRLSYVRQREVPTHTPSFEQAIVDSMRENPDVVVIGELRTPDVMRLTLNAAETGHLVLTTVHSASCAEALTRLCLSFPAEIQGGIRAQLADCLVGVVCQRLTYVPAIGLRVPHLEVLTASAAAKSNIRAGQFSQILSVLQAGGEDGHWTFERYQKWMEQKRDWVTPGQANPWSEEAIPETSSPERVAPAARGPRRMPAPAGPPAPSAERIEIAVAEDDLASLASRISDDEGD